MQSASDGPGVSARALALINERQLAAELARLGVGPQAVAGLAPCGVHANLLVSGLTAPVAARLCQEAAAARVVAAPPENRQEPGRPPGELLLMGSLTAQRALAAALRGAGPELAALAPRLEGAIESFLLRRPWTISLPDGRLVEGGSRTLVMGIINLTADSFSGDGVACAEPRAIGEMAARMVADGADLLDVGAESSRPGAAPVTADEELARLLPGLEAVLARVSVPVSVDTYKAKVARAAIGDGAGIINDITALHGDPQMAELAAELGAPLILMHMQGTPQTMQQHPEYRDLMSDVTASLAASMGMAAAAGVEVEQLVVDPGFGFGKTPEHNLELLRRLRELRSLGRPILVGTSRKSTIGKVLGDLPADQRVEGTAATVALAIAGGADIVRVHDVREMARVAKMADAVVRGWPPP